MQAIINTIVIVALEIAIFVLGVYVGKYILGSSIDSFQKPESFLKNKGQKKQNQLSIDDTKVVLKIDTGGMEKKFENIGKTKVAESDISSAINKLKNMKGN
jgi:hypothetical protein